jgi:uncharacterized repeat protein (TIGR04138 family)
MGWYKDDRRFAAAEPIASTSGFSVDALLFVFDALVVTPQYCGEEPGDVADPVRHCTAAELCRTIPLYARDLFGEWWSNALCEMKIFTSEDLGEIVFAMINANILRANAGDRIEDFSGVCRFVEDK